MELKAGQFGIINLVIQVDSEGKAKQYNLSDLTIASAIFQEIKKNINGEVFVDGNVELTSEQKVFLVKLIDARTWTVNDAEAIFQLKELIK